MSILSFLKRVFSRERATALSVEPAPMTFEEKYSYFPPCALELFRIIEPNVNEGDKDHYCNLIGGLNENTILEMIRASKENDYYDATIALIGYSKFPDWDESKLRDEAFFASVVRRYKRYHFNEAIHRLRKADDRFATCEFTDLDEVSRQHALALFSVIMHFVEYKGATSPDTSSFLREHPEMADRVISFIEQRGVGIGSFNTEVFTMAQETGVQVLDSGVL